MQPFFVFLLFIMGLYLPTSLSYEINTMIPTMHLIGLCVILAIWKVTQPATPKKLFFLTLAINFVIAISTLFSPFNEYSLGALLPFIAFSLLFCMTFKDIKFGKKVLRAFIVINIVNIFLGMLIVIDSPTIEDFFMKFYQGVHANALPNMFGENKPVLTFTSHSRAAFHFFLFFFLCLEGYKHTQKLIYFLLSAGYIVLMINLNSNTGYVFLFISCILLLAYLIKYKIRSLVYSLIGISIILLFNLNKIIPAVNNIYLEFFTTVSSRRNGLLGRFSSDGQLAENFKYMADNLFRPTGIGFSDALFFGDSALFLFMLRGTFLLVILIYVAMYLFYKRNIHYKYQAIILFVACLLMDIGSSTLLYFRTLYMIPFLIVFLNTVSSSEKKVLKKKKKIKIVWDKAS